MRSATAIPFVIACAAVASCAGVDTGPRPAIRLDAPGRSTDSTLWERRDVPAVAARGGALASTPEGDLLVVGSTCVARSRDEAASWEILTIPAGRDRYSNRGDAPYVARATLSDPAYVHGPVEPALPVVAATSNGSRVIAFSRGAYSTSIASVPLSAAFGRLDRWVFLAKGGLVEEDGSYNGPRVAAFDVFDRPVLAGAIDDRSILYAPSNDGDGWTPVWRGAPGGARIRAACMRDATTGYLVLSDGVVAVTNDSLRSWQVAGVLPPTIASRARDVEAFLGTHLVVAGDSGALALSTDSGQTWTTIESGTSDAILDVEALGSSLWAVGEAGLVLESRSGGRAWSRVHLPAGSTIRRVHVAAGRAWILADLDLYRSPLVEGGLHERPAHL